MESRLVSIVDHSVEVKYQTVQKVPFHQLVEHMINSNGSGIIWNHLAYPQVVEQINFPRSQWS